MATLLVDGENVRRSLWPNMSPDDLLERSRAWAAEQGVRTVVVFDGPAPGGLRGESELEDGTLLVGTGRQSADDWLTERAAQLAVAGEEVWLVTSDRELRRRTAGSAARTIGGGTFARELSGRG